MLVREFCNTISHDLCMTPLQTMMSALDALFDHSWRCNIMAAIGARTDILDAPTCTAQVEKVGAREIANDYFLGNYPAYRSYKGQVTKKME